MAGRARGRSVIQGSWLVSNVPQMVVFGSSDLTLLEASDVQISRAFEVNGIPPGKPPSYPRWKFVRENAIGAAWRFLAVDAATTFIRSTPLGRLPVTRSLRDEPVYRGLPTAALINLTARWAMDLTYRLIAAGAVAVGWGGVDRLTGHQCLGPG